MSRQLFCLENKGDFMIRSIYIFKKKKKKYAVRNTEKKRGTL